MVKTPFDIPGIFNSESNSKIINTLCRIFNSSEKNMLNFIFDRQYKQQYDTAQHRQRSDLTVYKKNPSLFSCIIKNVRIT